MLHVTDILTKVGYTIIDDVKVVQYTCQIPLANPDGMTVRRTVLDNKLYKEHRDECRADYAEFEDEAYEEQQQLINKSEE